MYRFCVPHEEDKYMEIFSKREKSWLSKSMFREQVKYNLPILLVAIGAISKHKIQNEPQNLFTI